MPGGGGGGGGDGGGGRGWWRGGAASRPLRRSGRTAHVHMGTRGRLKAKNRALRRSLPRFHIILKGVGRVAICVENPQNPRLHMLRMAYGGELSAPTWPID